MGPTGGQEMRELLWRDGRYTLVRVVDKGDGRGHLVKTMATAVSPGELILEYEQGRRGECPYFFRVEALRPENRALILKDEDVVPLRYRLAEEAGWEGTKGIELIVQVAELLAEFDRRHLVHGGLTVDGLFYNSADGRIRLGDWGGVRPWDSAGPGETGHGLPVSRSSLENNGNFDTFKRIVVDLVHLKGHRGTGGRLVRFLQQEMDEAGGGESRGMEEVAARLRKCLRRPDDVGPGPEEPPPAPLPSPWVGREAELWELKEAYARAARGVPQLVWLEGEPGVGKTALIRHFIGQIGDRGRVLTAKGTDQPNLRPYGALLAAGRRVLRYLLTLEDGELADWKERFDVSPGEMAALVDWLPELRHFLPLSKPGPFEAGGGGERFRHRLIHFWQVLVSGLGTLVLFLDDLQWMDPESVALVRELLYDPDSPGLLVIGTCRTENGIPETGMDELTTLRNVAISRENAMFLSLSPLVVTEIAQWLSEIFQRSPESVGALAELLHWKTRGNPLELDQTLRTAATDHFLVFRPATQRWEWRRDWTERLIDGPAALDGFASRFDQLPPSVRTTLTIASCLGFRFRRDWIAAVKDRPPEDGQREIDVAVQAGFLSVTGGEGGGPDCQFAHDRLRQIVEDRLDVSARAFWHRQIARVMEKTKFVSGDAEAGSRSDEEIYRLAYHWSAAAEELTVEERFRAARVHLEAGRRAKEAGAFQAARRYCTEGKVLLPGDAWKAAPDLMRDLGIAGGESAYLLGDVETARAELEDVFQRVSSRQGKLRVLYAELVLAYHAHYPGAVVEILHRALDLFGLSLPEKVGHLHLVRQGLLVSWWMKRRGARMEDPNYSMDPERALLLKLVLEGNGRVFDPKLHAYIVLWSFTFTLRHGRSEVSSYALSAYALYLGAMSDKALDGAALGRQAVRWATEGGDALMQANARFIYGGFLLHWMEPWTAAAAYLQQAKQDYEEKGEFFMAGTAAAFDFFARFQAGASVERLRVLVDEHGEWMDRIHLPYIAMFFHYARDVLDALLRTRQCPAWAPLPREVEETAYLSYADLWLCTAYILGEPGPVPPDIEGHLARCDAEVTTNTVPDICFWHALWLCRGPQDRGTWKKIRRRLGQLRRWASVNSENFRPRFLLVLGEVARLKGRHEKAQRYYEEAVQIAEAAGHWREAAMGCELAAKHAEALGRRTWGDLFLARAHSNYLRWGAWGKVAALRFSPQFLSGSAAARERAAEEDWGPDQEVTDSVLAGNDLIDGTAAEGRGPRLEDPAGPSLATALDPVYPGGSRPGNGVTWGELLIGVLARLGDLLQPKKLVLVAARGDNLVALGHFEADQGPVWLRQGEMVTEEQGPMARLVRYAWRTRQAVPGNEIDELSVGLGDLDAFRADTPYFCLPVDQGRGEVGILYVERRAADPLPSESMHTAQRLAMEFFALHKAAVWDSEAATAAPSPRAQTLAKALPAPYTPLTRRELEVLTLMAEGLSNQEIADELGVAVSTVKVHVKNILGKLQANRRTLAIRRAQELRLIGAGRSITPFREHQSTDTPDKGE